MISKLQIAGCQFHLRFELELERSQLDLNSRVTRADHHQEPIHANPSASEIRHANFDISNPIRVPIFIIPFAANLLLLYLYKFPSAHNVEAFTMDQRKWLNTLSRFELAARGFVRPIINNAAIISCSLSCRVYFFPFHRRRSRKRDKSASGARAPRLSRTLQWVL